MRPSDVSTPGRLECMHNGLPALARRVATPLLAVGVVACVLFSGCGGGRAGRLERQMAWVASHPRAPRPVVKAVLGKKLQEGVGMTTDAVVASWGDPDERLDLGGGDARWVYRKGQTRNATRVTIEYTLIFNRGYLTKVLQSDRR